ncbi:hypothetical protein [Phocaeicola sp.]|uniref:hypothetical protein n=1 Tax=Phocaeicola sp. TaxID=2773926 RepID=UPI003AB7A210
MVKGKMKRICSAFFRYSVISKVKSVVFIFHHGFQNQVNVIARPPYAPNIKRIGYNSFGKTLGRKRVERHYQLGRIKIYFARLG